MSLSGKLMCEKRKVVVARRHLSFVISARRCDAVMFLGRHALGPLSRRLVGDRCLERQLTLIMGKELILTLLVPRQTDRPHLHDHSRRDALSKDSDPMTALVSTTKYAQFERRSRHSRWSGLRKLNLRPSHAPISRSHVNCNLKVTVSLESTT